MFQQCGLSLHAAKITTIGERVEDFFSLTTLAGEPLTQAEQQALEERLVNQLNPQESVMMRAGRACEGLTRHRVCP